MDLGADLTRRSGAYVSLLADVQDDQSPFSLTYHWEQVDGPAVSGLDDDDSELAGFTLPRIFKRDSGPQTVTLRLTVTDPGGLSASDEITITIEPESSAPYRERVQVGGPITQDTTWSGDKIYEAQDNISIPAGVKLTIEAGAVVRLADGKKLLVDGELVANGVMKDGEPIPIVFTNIPGSLDLDWDGIEVRSGGHADLLLVVIEKALTGLYMNGGGVTMGNVLFQNNIVGFDTGVTKKQVSMAYNTFYQNFEGVDVYMTGTSVIHHNLFKGNDYAFFELSGSDQPFDVHDNNFVDNGHVITAREINDFYLPGQARLYNNWWGTTDMTAIERLITDAYDDPRLMDISPTPASAYIPTAWAGIPAGFQWYNDLP